jgi:5,10-methylenetetrahydrofolate reductase
MMPIQTYGGFKRMTSLCKTFIPEHINKVRRLSLAPVQCQEYVRTDAFFRRL